MSWVSCHFNGCEDDLLQHLLAYPNLRQLNGGYSNLNHLRKTDNFIERLLLNLPLLEYVRLQGNWFRPESLSFLLTSGKSFPNLLLLNLARNRLYSEGCKILTQAVALNCFPNLEDLNVEGNVMTHAHAVVATLVAALATHCPRLRVLNVSNYVDDEGERVTSTTLVESLPRMANLYHFDFWSCNFNFSGCVEIQLANCVARAPNLVTGSLNFDLYSSALDQAPCRRAFFAFFAVSDQTASPVVLMHRRDGDAAIRRRVLAFLVGGKRC